MQQPISSLHDQLLRSKIQENPLPYRTPSNDQRYERPQRKPIPISRSKTPPRPQTSRGPSPAQRRPETAISTSERHFAISNVGDDGTIYLRYGPSENESQDTFKQALSDEPRPSERSSTMLHAHPPAFGLPPSPAMSPSELSADVPSYFHDGLHESAAAAVNYPTSRGSDGLGLYTPSVQTNGTRTDQGRRSSLTNPYTNHTQQKTSTQFALAPFRVPPVPRQPQQQAYDATRLHPSTARRHSIDRPTPIPDSSLMLQVPIPSHRIGTPRIGERGTVYLHDSFYSAGSDLDDYRTSNYTHLELDEVFPAPPNLQSASPYLDVNAALSRQALAAAPTPPEAVQGIDPNIYNAFVDDPDNPRYIRYMATGQILAATPARLISQITHVRFLDYDLLSDFFLTYRSFISAMDLLRYMIARLRWAVFVGDGGRVVRVRTFVAIRHWVLNYFMDDFEPQDDLRKLLCDLVNKLARDLRNRADGGGGDLQVVGELKKCWRRTCDIIWGTNEGARNRTATDEIYPSGSKYAQPSDHTGANGRTEQEDRRRQQQQSQQDFFDQQTRQSTHQRIASWDPVDLAKVATPVSALRFRQDSLDVTSCSIPLWRTLGRATPSFRPKALGPVEESPRKAMDVPQLPSAPLRSKRSKSSKGSNDGSVVVSPPEHDANGFLLMDDMGDFDSGDLIRGLSIPPPLPTISREIGAAAENPFSTQFGGRESEERRWNAGGAAIKRKLSGRNGPLAAERANSPLPKRLNTGSRNKLSAQKQSHFVSRSDMLAARVADTYERLLREDRGASKAAHPTITEVPQQTPSLEKTDQHDFAHSRENSTADLEKELPLPPSRNTARFNSHMTTSSRSIMIINDVQNMPPPIDFDLHDKILPAEDRRWQPSPSRNDVPLPQMPGTPPAEIRHDTPAGISDSPSPPSMQGKAIPHVNTKTLKVGGAAEKIQYSNSPASAMADDIPHGLGLLLPDIDPNDDERDDPDRPSVFRKSSDLDPYDVKSEASTSQPNQLRRRPGGDLRKVGKVDDLSQTRLRRNSTGTIANNRISGTTSATLSTEIVDAPVIGKMAHPKLVSYHAGSEHGTPPRRKSLQLLSTHSSRPNLRPSFQMEVDKLAKLPNGDDDDDGGISSTLAKLEGRVSALSNTSMMSPLPDHPISPKRGSLVEDDEVPDRTKTPPPPKNKRRSRVQVIGHPDHPETSRLDLTDAGNSPTTDRQGASIYAVSRSSRATPEGRGVTMTESQYSDNPYMANGLPSHFSGNGNEGTRWSHIHAPTPRRSDSHSRQNWPLPAVMAKDLGQDAPRSSTRASTNTPKSSFFLNDDESLSGSEDDAAKTNGHSRKVSEQTKSSVRNSASTNGDRSFFFEEDREDEDRAVTPTNKGAYEPPLSPPPSTPLPAIPFQRPLYDPIPIKAATRLRTPGPTDQPIKPSVSFTTPPKSLANGHITRSNPSISIAVPRTPTPTHTPFILAFPSALLASHLTIIERDALSQIDWLELVNQSWSPTPSPIRDWASYLRTPAQTGVDIVIARFNMVVKWVVSEILLTANVEDRARTVGKFIHIAAHARRLRNFASAYQVTLALLSTSVQRLKRTFMLLSQEEKALLRKLEEMVQPARNFGRLRSEMEAALLAPAVDAVAGKGQAGIRVKAGACVPFIGIYTHDLAFNAQKPAFLDSVSGLGRSREKVAPAPVSRTGSLDGSGGQDRSAAKLDGSIVGGDEAMVNFERFQTCAGIVKGLLRLLEASARYSVRPNREVVARCLWLGALEEGEIEARSRGLEGVSVGG